MNPKVSPSSASSSDSSSSTWNLSSHRYAERVILRKGSKSTRIFLPAMPGSSLAVTVPQKMARPFRGRLR